MLKMRLCDLPLKNVDKRLKKYHELLSQELKNRAIDFDFHLWVSDDWFCPDGVPGIALPFYLFNRELMKIEFDQVGYIEGGYEKQILKLLRHELGHCIDNAFHLRKDRRRQQLFGSSKIPYPKSYKPKKYSRSYVHYLGDSYAQSHPDEDFAETFAVWLDSQSQWEKRYQQTKAINKLNLMNQMMCEISNKRSLLKNNYQIDSIDKQKQSLNEYYKEKRKRLRLGNNRHFEHNLKRYFSRERLPESFEFSIFLKRERRHIEKVVSKRTGAHSYEIAMVIKKALIQVQNQKIYATKEQLFEKTPLMIEQNYRYLKEKHQLKYFL